MTVDRSYICPDIQAGMDHDHYEWSPLNAGRARLVWPRQASIALCVIVTLEHMEWSRPAGNFQLANLAGGYGPAPHPNVTAWSHREYGHRVGIFRVLDLLARHGITPTIAMDALTAEHYPYLVRHCLERGCDFIAHGISVNRMITSHMTEAEERRYIRTSIDSVMRATGVMPHGWLGPELGESTRTPQLLAEAGIHYVCDWANDEQPYPFKTPLGELYALPIMLPLDDLNALWDRRVDVGRYEEMLKEAFDVLNAEGASSGRLLALHLHPWLIGQPFRIRHLDAALTHMMQQDGVWAATGTQIIEHYRLHCAGKHPV